MSQARPVRTFSTELNTRRCSERRFFLNPCAVVSEIVLYVFAVIANRYGIAVHALCVMSSHYHLVMTDVRGKLPKFFQDAHSLIARSLNAFHGRSENFFAGGKQPSRVELLDEEAQLEKLIYLYTNPVAAGLVKRWEEWPGVITKPCFRGAYTIRVKRPRFFFRAKRWPAEITLRITPPPALAHLDPKELGDRLFDGIKKREKEIREQFRREGRKFLGRKGVLHQKHTKQAASEEALFAMNPRVACKDVSRRAQWLKERKEWLDQHRQAFVALRDKAEVVVPFPEGSWKWVEFGGGTVETAPG
ncbi:MAG: hypothetical protein AAF517_09110 [Planctomycetota bacterium]